MYGFSGVVVLSQDPTSLPDLLFRRTPCRIIPGGARIARVRGGSLTSGVGEGFVGGCRFGGTDFDDFALVTTGFLLFASGWGS